MKNKPSTDILTQNVQQKHTQATEEQIRVAKLSQINKKDDSHEDKIKQVSDITMKPLDIVSLALHDTNYDTSMAIQNIFEGKYDDQDEWQTTVTKKGKKSAPVSNHTNSVNNKTEPLEFEENDQKPNNTRNTSRGGGTSGFKGRPSSRNRKEDKGFNEERADFSQERSDTFSRDRIRGGLSDRGRSRGRGRGGSRGGAGRGGGAGGSGRGGFGRGGSVRGTRQSNRGAGRGGRKPRREENGFGEPKGGFGEPGDWSSGSGGGFGTPAVTESQEDWGDEVITDQVNNDWPSKSTTNWGDEEMITTEADSSADKVDSLFSSKADWNHVNGTKEENTWDNTETLPSSSSHIDQGKYVPEEIDAAVICSIPTSATSAEVTSYQPTNDIGRYITNTVPSNQFPSSQQEGGLTSSLNERDYTNLTDSIHQQNMPNMPMVSGITESHKLEQEQRNSKVINKSQKPQPRKLTGKGVSMPSQPAVVMPRSAQMVHDVGEQFAGLEFGSGPVSPRLLKNTNTSLIFTSDLSNTESLENSVTRQPVANLQERPVTPPSSTQQQQQDLLTHHTIMSSKSTPTKSESPKLSNESPELNGSMTGSSLGAFKSLESSQTESYLGSPGRGLSHAMATEPIPFPSSTNLPSSPTSSSSLDVFSRHSGLGTSVTMAMEPQQKLSSYPDSSKAYNSNNNSNSHEANINTDKMLADKQYLDQQRVLAEQQHRETITEQRAAFAEQKALAQQKLLASQRSKDDSRSSEAMPSNLKDSRKTIPESRLGLTDAAGSHQAKDSPSKSSSNESNNSNSSYNSNKNHRSTNARSISSPPGLSSSSVYASNTTKSSELLNQASSAGSTKHQSKASSAPPGMIHPNLLYAGVQPGILPAAYQQMHGYNYDELLQLQQRQLHQISQSPYHYDVSTMYPTATAAGTREQLANYQASDSKFARANDESTQANLHQANAHVAASHQAYMNATGQIPYGFTYAYQPGVMPQAAGLYPAFTAPNVYLNQAAKGVVGTQYQSQYPQQPTYNTGNKYSGSGNHDFSKGNFHSSSSSQTTMSKSGNQGMNNSNDSGQNAGSFKGQGYNDGKGFLGSSPSQPTMTMHGQNAHINPYLLAQQQQQHNSLLTGPNQLGHQGNHDNRSGVGHQVSFAGSQQQKREGKGGNSYQSYWSGGTR